MAKKLELFYKDSCPFCHKVLDFMNENGIVVDLLDVVSEPANKERLIQVGGKSQVPCLFVDGEPMYESMDIINFLAKEFHTDEPKFAPGEVSGACSIDGTGCN